MPGGPASLDTRARVGPRGSCLVRSGGPGQSNLPNRQRSQTAPHQRSTHMSSQSFADLGASSAVAEALASRGVTTPFPVQSLVLPDALAGRDVLVKSPTGSGKTLAFAIPLAELLESDGPRQSALVLAPTRELVSQIVEEMLPLAHSRALSVAAVYGGAGIQPQIKRAAPRPHHRRDARPARGPDRARRRQARQRPHAGARRGGPDARHGLQAGGRPHRRPGAP